MFQSLAAENRKEWRPKEVRVFGVTRQIPNLLERRIRVGEAEVTREHKY